MDYSQLIIGLIVGFFLYVLGVGLPFATLIWVMLIKLCMGGDIYKNLGWANQADKNRYLPRLVDKRNARFIH